MRLNTLQISRLALLVIGCMNIVPLLVLDLHGWGLAKGVFFVLIFFTAAATLSKRPVLSVAIPGILYTIDAIAYLSTSNGWPMMTALVKGGIIAVMTFLTWRLLRED